MEGATVSERRAEFEQKLAEIDKRVEEIEKENIKRKELGIAPIDPQEAFMCEGCQ